MQNKISFTTLATSITLISSILFTASCSTVSVNQKSSSQTIADNRSNIVTKSSLSNKSNSQLISIGMPANECFNNFNQCLETVDKGFLEKNNKEYLALFAELYLAKAKAIEESERCIDRITRPPIDPYYSNAPKTPKEQAETIVYLTQCNMAYRQNLLNAIKYSYAYLFYNQLKPGADADDEVSIKPNKLPTNLDIQTQDVYDDASDRLIKQLYSNKNESEQSRKVTSFIGSKLIKDTEHSNNSGNRSEYGEQIKVLNFTFPPIEEDQHLAELLEEAEQIEKIEVKDSSTEDNRTDNSKAKTHTLELDSLSNTNTTTSIDLYLPNEPEYLQNTEKYHKSIEVLYASHDLTFSGLNTVSARDGFGISYVSLLDNRLKTSVKELLRSDNKKLNSENPEDRIHLTGVLLITGMVIPQGTTLQQVLDSNNFDINLYNPHHTKTINILGEPFYLAANFSAGYGMWVAENHMGNVGYFNMLSKQQNLVMPQLFMLEPYDPNKRIIIMLHGLASSPATWVSVTNDISNDEELRENYQVWQIFYPTNIPMLENRYQIQQLIETAYKMNDPNGQDIASHNSVLIGHSMGAVIGRMLVSNENLEAKYESLSHDNLTRRLNKLVNDQLDKEKILNRLHLKQLDSVDTAVFISAPFRGTDFADRWFTQLLRRVVHLPIGFIQTITGNLANIATEGELASNPLGALYFQNGASQLSDKSSFMKLTADLEIADNVTYHSIIANRDSDLYHGLMRLNITPPPETALADPNTPEVLAAGVNTKVLDYDADSNDEEQQASLQKMDKLTQEVTQSVTPAMSDGIVPYSSSHLEGAASETIIKGGHSIQDTPEAILTLRKILHQHLHDHPMPKQEQ